MKRAVFTWCAAGLGLIVGCANQPELAPRPKHAPAGGISLADVGDPILWKALSPLPDKLGFAGGYAGLCGGSLVFAGGANFPEKPPWEGGRKVWHDTIYSLQSPNGKWAAIGSLPRPLGYGVSLSYKASVICIGGGDAGDHYADVFQLDETYHGVKIRSLPSLPTTLAFGCGAIVGDVVYVAGGLETPLSTTALRRVFRLNLADAMPQWEEIAPWPGPARLLAVAGSDGEAFYLFSGAELVTDPDGKPQRRYLADAYRYSPGIGWDRLADLPRPALGAPSPAAFETGKLTIFSGDDGTQVNSSPQQHRGFADSRLQFSINSNQWAQPQWPCPPRVTTPLVQYKSIYLIPSGEVKPGVRSAEVSIRDPLAEFMINEMIRGLRSFVQSDTQINGKGSNFNP